MKYNKKIVLKNGKECILRNGLGSDGQAVLDNFNLTHEQTDYLSSYPDENSFDVKQESNFLKMKAASEREAQILALVHDKVVGMAGISAVGVMCKDRHRAVLGMAIEKDYWGLGIGMALLDACIECAKNAGYFQLELEVVAENENAIALYKKSGFIEFGRNPKGLCSRISGYQELIYMRLEL